MKNNLKIPLIILLALTGFAAMLALALCTPYIARKVRVWKLTRDMTGGTSLVYEIDTRNLSEEQQKDLSKKVIFVLRRRIDPRGILPIVFQPLDDTRFEIQISPAANFPTAKDIQRMLKGAGILEFRILPTEGHPEVDTATIKDYVERLKEKGPEYASDNAYKWCEIENFERWAAADALQRPSIVGTFGDKYYVLASNKPGEAMLFGYGQDAWKLEKAYPTSDNMGRRAIGFAMDNIGGKLFADITGNNRERPLCILLDGIAISAPCINDRIYGRGIITGSFSQTEIEDIVNMLNAGSLPARLIEQPIEIKTIGLNNNSNNSDTTTAIGNNL